MDEIVALNIVRSDTANANIHSFVDVLLHKISQNILKIKILSKLFLSLQYVMINCHKHYLEERCIFLINIREVKLLPNFIVIVLPLYSRIQFAVSFFYFSLF